MGLKGNKSSEQSVSNALNNMRKAGAIVSTDGKYAVVWLPRLEPSLPRWSLSRAAVTDREIDTDCCLVRAQSRFE